MTEETKCLVHYLLILNTLMIPIILSLGPFLYTDTK
jgi:hypothetical protein